MRFRSILRRLWKPAPLTDEPMPHLPAQAEMLRDPTSLALEAAVVAHERAGARERKRYVGDLLASIDEALAKLAPRDKDSHH